MKWKKNQFVGRKVVGLATMFAHWAQKVGGPLPNRLCRQCHQWMYCHVLVSAFLQGYAPCLCLCLFC